jgi:hypothetical protein
MSDLETLRSAVQHNCHISDALFARDYSLCIYLLKMREYFRWEKGLGYADPLPERELGHWLTEREELWQRIEEQPFRPVPAEGGGDPFDTETINGALLARGLVYSAGYGQGAKPHFFLGRLLREIREPELRILISGVEYARDITAPPAMLQGTTLFVRRESLRRLLWERLEEWRWRRQESPMARAASHYAFDTDFDAALESMTDAETESTILHERGERQAGKALGPGWEEMLAAVPRSRTEYILRSVRDHLADCAVTLPALLHTDARASIHFYFANLTGMRRALFPSLLKGYEAWNESGSLIMLSDAITDGQDYWRQTAHLLLANFEDKRDLNALAKLANQVQR